MKVPQPPSVINSFRNHCLISFTDHTYKQEECHKYVARPVPSPCFQAYILTSSTDLEASTFLTFPILSYKSIIGLVDCRYVWILGESKECVYLHNNIKTEENWKVLDIVPFFQTLPIIIASTTALASFKTATNTYLQKTSKGWS